MITGRYLPASSYLDDFARLEIGLQVPVPGRPLPDAACAEPLEGSAHAVEHLREECIAVVQDNGILGEVQVERNRASGLARGPHDPSEATRAISRAAAHAIRAFDDTDGRCVQGSHMMRIAASLLAVFAVAAGAAAGPDAVPSPSLETEELVYDAGKVSRGVTVTHAFLLKNVGTADLSVDAKPG